MFAVQGLKELVANEEQVLFQTSNALSQCIKSVSNNGAAFIGSSQAVECHRLLLVASTIAESLLYIVRKSSFLCCWWGSSKIEYSIYKISLFTCCSFGGQTWTNG